MKSRTLVFLIAAATTLTATAQNIQYGESFGLNSPLSPTQVYEYTANNYIDLNSGFHSEPKIDYYTTLQLDPYGIYPPEAGLTGGPNSSDKGVVGALGGVVDVGAMGAAIYSIPIEVPQGINGMQPSLSITYNSQAGNGLLGWGWDIAGLSSIERTGKTQYHDGTVSAVTINDDTDGFILDGKRLIVVADYIDSIEYKTERDEMSKVMAYFRIEQIGGGLFGSGTIRILDHFVVWKAEGIMMRYGTSNDTQIKLQESSDICCWLLHQTIDRNGNYIVYHYDTNSTGYRLAYIDYTCNQSLSPSDAPLFRMSFSYNSRPDTDIIIIGQNKIKHTDLLKTIQVNKKIDNQYIETERYDFTYQNVDASTGYFYTRLNEIHLYSEKESINPTKIIWPQQNNNYSILLHKGINTPGHADAFHNAIKFSGDFNGDGYTDVIVAKPDNNDRCTWAEVYLNQGQENAVCFDYVTGFQLNDSVEWIHVADFNGDGKDDFLISDKQRRSWPLRDLLTMNVYLSHFSNNTLSFIHLPQLGPYKIKRNYIESVLIGDYFGKGKDCIIIQASQEDEDHVGQFHYDKAYYFVCSSDESEMTAYQFNDYIPSLKLFTTDFDGDGAAEVMYLTENEYYINKLHETESGGHYYIELSHGNNLNNSYDCYLGDFNGDGKKDVLSCHLNGNNESVWQINLSGSLGLIEPAYAIDNFGLEYLGPNHHFSLKVHYENLRHLQVADFNGDGYDDIKHPYQHGGYYEEYYFGPIVEMGQHTPFSGKKRIYAQYSPHSNLETCLGCFRGKETCDDLGDEEIYHLEPILNRYCVNGIIDGMGNKTEFTYDYLMQKTNSPNSDTLFYLLDRNQEALENHVTAIALPSKAVKTVTSYNVSGKPSSTSYRYRGILYHSQGKGVLGFTSILSTASVFFTEGGTVIEDVVSTNERYYSLRTPSQVIYTAPSLLKTYGGNGILLSETTYNNTTYINARSENHKVYFPAVTRITTDDFNPDDASFLKRSITVFSHETDNTGAQYNNDVFLTKSKKGFTTGPNATMINSCEYRSMDSITYYNNDYSTWTVNRIDKTINIQSRDGHPDVKYYRKYEYTANNPYLPSRVYDSPGDISAHDPLTLRTDYEYYADGNLKKKTVTAPYGQLGEQQKTVEYDYGPGDQQRLVTKETVSSGDLSYETSYSYDLYDRVDTLTGANGLATTFDNDAFGITSWTQNADGTQSCAARRWASGHPLKPQGALYYTWERSSDERQNLVFFHKTGTELRSVAYGIHGEPIITDKRYDSRGRLSAVSDPYKEGETPRWTIYGYDNFDRLDSIIAPDTTVTSIVYDGFRTETTVTTPQGLTQESATVVNAMGWTVRSEDASGSHVVFDHYADGLMATATVNDNAAATVTTTYDNARRKSTVTDPDYGTLTTVYDAYGRLKRSVSPREQAGQTETANYYDGFDRLVMTTDGLENTQTNYDYNETGVLKGSLDGIRFKFQNGSDIQHLSYSYDTLARPVQVTEQRPTGTYTTTMAYDSQSRVGRLAYPSGFTVRYGYLHGFLRSVTDDKGLLLWKANDMDAQGRPLEVELGNGAITRYTYDTVMHRLQGIVTTKNLQNLTYGYDKFGNLASRKDNKTNMEETFTYDDMNRLTGITLKRPSGQDLYCSATYDALGRMTSKEAVTKVNNVPQVITVFSLPVFDNTKVHALSQVQTAEGVFPSTDQTVTYTGFDKVGKVKQGNDSICYSYGYDRQRISMEEHVGNTTRTKRYVGNCEYVTETTGGYTETQWLTYLTGPMGVFAVMAMEGGDAKIHYILKDNLGSWTTITDEEGSVEQNLSYDAWGNLRNPNTWTNYTASDSFDKPMFDRGFTGHEHLTAFGLINMNGRIYDPVMSLFLSADRYVQDPSSAQGFNRYAYCLYNPLRYVDPSGWKPKQRVYGPISSSYYARDFYTFAERAYEPGDFRNAYYMLNEALYGDMGGPGGGGGGGQGGNYYGSYGYYVTHYASSVYNYTFPSAQFQLIRNWHNNPCYSTNKEMCEAGITNLTAGVSYGGDGYRNSYYTWTDSNGNTHTAKTLNEYVGGNKNGAFAVSNLPLKVYGLKTSLETANILAQSIGVPMGTISELVEIAAKSYYNVPVLKVRSGLSQAQKITALSKEGVSLLKVSKGLGRFCAGVSVGISGYQTYNYYANGGTGYDVLIKGVADVGMVVVGVYGGPIGLGISIGYFVLDLSTDGFGVSYEIKP